MVLSRFVSRFQSLLGTAVMASAALFGASCAPDKMPFARDDVHVFAGGVEVDGRTLNAGYQSYMRYCYACHGVEGDGHGPASYGLRPPPRDFRKGIFKFARMRSSDDYPNDDDLIRIVKGGLHGTAMLPWDIQDDELSYVLQYIKTFHMPAAKEGEDAPVSRWEKKKKNGDSYKVLDPYEPGADPWAGNEQAAALEGRKLYHFRAECLNCHPAYGGKEELYKLSVQAAKDRPEAYKAITGFRDDPYHSVPKDSAEYNSRIMPPDFTFSKVRSVRKGHEMEDLVRIISYGVYPIMPAWKDAGLSDKDIWAIAHYVKTLLDERDTPESMAKKQSYLNQAPFEVPKPVEDKPATAEEEKKDDAKKDDAKKDDAKKDDAKKVDAKPAK